MQAQRGGRGVAVPICILGTGRGEWSMPCCGHFTTEAWWAPGQFRVGLEKRKLLPPLGFE